MTTATRIDWSDPEAAARQVAGNWRNFKCFCWDNSRLPYADDCFIWNLRSRDAGLLEESNCEQIKKGLEPFTEGDDPAVWFETHRHWAVGWLEAAVVRVFDPQTRAVTAAFEEFCRIKERLDDYPILNEQDYTEREFEATLDNYRGEMWRLKDNLPDGWEDEVYSWFSDHGKDRYIENRDDRGGYAPREAITEALQDLGLLPTLVVGK
jgi:hypothetical protein